MNILASLHPTFTESSNAFKLDIMCMLSADVPTDWMASLRHVTKQADRHASSFTSFSFFCGIARRCASLHLHLGQHNDIPTSFQSFQQSFAFGATQ